MDNIAKPRIGKAGVCMSEKIKSKKDLKDWLKYELDKYDNRGGTLPLYCHIRERYN